MLQDAYKISYQAEDQGETEEEMSCIVVTDKAPAEWVITVDHKYPPGTKFTVRVYAMNLCGATSEPVSAVVHTSTYHCTR